MGALEIMLIYEGVLILEKLEPLVSKWRFERFVSKNDMSGWRYSLQIKLGKC